MLATKINYLDQTAALVEQQKARARTKEAEAAAFDLQARINETKATYADQFAKVTEARVAVQVSERYVPPHLVGGAATVGQKGMEKLYVPAHGGYARTDEEAKAIRDHDARTATINGALPKRECSEGHRGHQAARARGEPATG